ncbi:hypothetical protein ACLOJK_029108 [Asimina triloba]
MATKTLIRMMVPVPILLILFLFLLVFIATDINIIPAAAAAAAGSSSSSSNSSSASAVVQFIFGDSLLDVGNNIRLSKSLARPALPWYGIDFGDGLPNGRFTNGRTVSDIIGDKLGYPRPPAFLDPSVDEYVVLQNGLNYASGGAGILNDTSSFFVQRFSLYKQIELFQGTGVLISRKIGNDAAQKLLSEASYVVSMGSNDFINNFLMPEPWVYTDSAATQFLDLLLTTLRDQLKVD